MIRENYVPTFEIPETMAPDIVGYKTGQRVKMLANVTIVERMKNYIVLQVNYISLEKSKRSY